VSFTIYAFVSLSTCAMLLRSDKTVNYELLNVTGVRTLNLVQCLKEEKWTDVIIICTCVNTLAF